MDPKVWATLYVALDDREQFLASEKEEGHWQAKVIDPLLDDVTIARNYLEGLVK